MDEDGWQKAGALGSLVHSLALPPRSNNPRPGLTRPSSATTAGTRLETTPFASHRRRPQRLPNHSASHFRGGLCRSGGAGPAALIGRNSRAWGFPAPPRRPITGRLDDDALPSALEAARWPVPRYPAGGAEPVFLLPTGPILKARVPTPRLLERAPGSGQRTAGAGQGLPRRA